MSTIPKTAFQTSHKVVRGVDRRLRSGLTVARAVHSGAWLGALSPDALATIDESTYDRSYGYHATDSHNLRGLFPWELAALHDDFPDGGRLLVTSAGGGREVVALCREGFAVDAWECHDGLRSFANDLLERQGIEAEVIAAPRSGWVDTGETYDGIVVGWGSYSNIRGRERRIALLKGLASLAGPGAPVLLSFFAREPGDRVFQLAARIGNRVAGLFGREPLEVGDVIDPTYQHYFDREELFAELESAGIEPVRWSTEGYAHAVGRTPGANP